MKHRVVTAHDREVRLTNMLPLITVEANQGLVYDE